MFPQAEFFFGGSCSHINNTVIFYHLENLIAGIQLVLTWKVLLVILCSCAFGLFTGAMPGLSATVAVALLVPVTFYLEPAAALASIATAVALAIFAGDIPGALLRIPGVPSSAAYADEAYAMTKKGLGEKVLGISLVCSVIGGLCGAVALSLCAPLLAEFALEFQYYEYFWLACMGLTTAAFVCADQPTKGLISTGLGLLLSMVGFDMISGTLIGALPGAGSDMAAWVSYALARKFSKEPEKFGTGHPEGIVAASASNNSSTCATWIPSLVFGIPGDSVTAIGIGVLFLKGLQPGPAVFLENAPLVYSIFVSFFIANLVLLPMGFIAIKISKQLLRVPTNLLMPLVLVFCIVGSFAINNSIMGVIVILALGIVSLFIKN